MEIAVLRLLHLGFGLFWAGGAITAGLWVIPSILDAGPGGGPVMRGMMMDRKFPLVMITSGWITVLAGLRLYQLKFSMGWLGTPEGIVLTLGGLLAIAALVIGMVAQRPTAMKLAALGAQVAASGGPPSPEQAAEIGRLQGKLRRIALVLAAHVGAAVVLMASMRLAQQLGT